MTQSDPPPAPSSPIAPGYRLDRYEMLCPIAEGGMASVWVARLRGKRGFEKLVAIKTILPKFAQDSRFERMFLDEAGLAARIEHANVAQVLDLGEEHEVLYLTMELVDGDSLSKLMRTVEKKGMTIPTGIILRVLADTCGGLHAAHEVRGKDGDLLNVVHRDISPQNILVTMNGIAKLIDFGIAKARDRVSEDTSDGMLKGKIHYMAPEQALGKKVDRRADIWAIGAIIYFLLAGKPAFQGENHLATLFLLAAGRPPLPLPSSVHPAVNAVVRKALSHNPDDRYATAAEMQGALETAMREADIATTTSGVAAFVQEHMAERAKKRREGLDLALSAAAQREKVARMLEKVGADSSSGHGTAEDDDIPVVDATYATVLLGSPSSQLHNEATSPASRTPHSESSATLGSALASPVPPASRPRKLGWVVGLVMGIITFALVVGLLARANNHGAAVAASRAEGPPAVPPPGSGSPSSSAATPVPDGSAAPSTPTGPGWNETTRDASAEPEMSPSATAPVSTASTVPTSTPRATTRTTPSRHSATPATSATPQKHRVNDGF